MPDRILLTSPERGLHSNIETFSLFDGCCRRFYLFTQSYIAIVSDFCKRIEKCDANYWGDVNVW